MSQYDTRMTKVAQVINLHGLHKVAEIVMRMDGIEPPAEWTEEGIGMCLGIKVAKDRADRRAIADGLVAFAQVLR